ncbi:MBL fold metallo-hydrolase [Xylanibacillus composti]|uniref:Putative metallo-hydrolase YycJ n=1 Tax=Xylanibacillus composti TaxID=1572762 RepID=A0A8J4H7M5_9BACL|nr:MBL fold metallo-hydrolase [Xylanibacillus composti]MDT9725264.1 MBL fold metallo-hydrolase [Xylanibacillus composti]GIQ70464.1 putative metallo-hydrolase YycJ [Xylanibacillus composti]
MSLQFSILASGSSGNAMVVRNKEASLLVDAGLSAKKLAALMEARGVDAAKLDGILVTHEHADHIRGLGVMSRKYNLPIYANDRTWEAMRDQIGEIEEDKVRSFETGDRLDFGMLQVESYAISHDAAEPVGYVFHYEGCKLSLATDLGYVSPKVKEAISDSDVLILESNHDVDMLRVGRYPWNIKRRILSDTGHLSNEAAGEALCELASDRTRRVYLAHLSRDHNLMDLARLTVNNVLQERGITPKPNRMELMDTYYDRPTQWDALG